MNTKPETVEPASAAESIRVLLVEDDKLLRMGLKLVLNSMACVRVVGEADNGRAAIDKTLELLPDVVVLDIGLPVISGLEALCEIKRQRPATRVLMLTSHEEMLSSALKAGADGFCQKTITNEQLYRAIQTVVSGQTWFADTV